MSSVRTTKSSILKNYVATNRNQIKHSFINRVRFELLADKSLHKLLLSIEEQKPESVGEYNEYLSMIRDENISEADFLSAIQESKECIELLTKYEELAKALIDLDWLKQNDQAIAEYQSFLIDLLSSHNKFVKPATFSMISKMIPRDSEQFMWKKGEPSDEVNRRITHVVCTTSNVMDVIPLSMNTVLKACAFFFPFYTKPSFVFAGFVRNLIKLMNYHPSIKEELFSIILNKLIVLDANTPRQDIELAEMSDSEDDEDEMFELEMNERSMKKYTKHPDQMKSEQAESLDLCMNLLFEYIKHEHRKEGKGCDSSNSQMFKILMENFETMMLPAHNTHHVQFLLFYFCSFDTSFAESFTNTCWQKLCHFNCPTPIRQSAIGYLASMLTRSLFITVDVLKENLADMCVWIRQYIQRCDSGQNSYSLKAHSVFYATCQALFYVISFRSRDLTSSNKNLHFLQGLQLNTIVTSNLNPLRFCLPAVATAFSGVTRAHQLAYCHTILERNARRKLATIYTNDMSATEEVLETFFPFDQYMLKLSGDRITSIYREYQSSEAEEEHVHEIEDRQQKRRKDMESGSFVDGMEDFIMRDKRIKISELSKSFDRDLHFHNMNTTAKKT